MLQASEINYFQGWAVTCLAGVIMPPAIRELLKKEVEAVTLPFEAVQRCGNLRAKWNIYCNRVMGAVVGVLDDCADSTRIITDYRQRLEQRRF